MHANEYDKTLSLSDQMRVLKSQIDSYKYTTNLLKESYKFQ